MSTPFLLSYHAIFLDEVHLSEKSSRNDRFPCIDPFIYLVELWNLAIPDKIYGFIAGCLVGIGYTLYFTSSNTISPTIALGIASCEPLGNIFVAAVILRKLREENFLYKMLVLASSCSFVFAIVLMSLSSGY